MKDDTPYLNWDNTPKKWHYFMCFITPLAGIVNLGNAASDYNYIYAHPEMKHYFIELGIYGIIMLLSIASVIISILMFAAFSGLVRRKWFGAKALIAAYSFSFVRNILYASIVLYYYDLFEGELQKTAWTIVLGVLCATLNWNYYKKRRKLFHPIPIDQEISSLQITIPNEELSYSNPEILPNNCVTLLEQLRDETEKETSMKENKKARKR